MKGESIAFKGVLTRKQKTYIATCIKTKTPKSIKNNLKHSLLRCNPIKMIFVKNQFYFIFAFFDC